MTFLLQLVGGISGLAALLNGVLAWLTATQTQATGIQLQQGVDAKATVAVQAAQAAAVADAPRTQADIAAAWEKGTV